MEEIFKEIKGYEGLYKISNMGNVISLTRNIPLPNGGFNKINEFILKPIINKGYKKVSLNRSGKKQFFIHHLVWNVFGDGRLIEFPVAVIDHIDGNKLNNTITNLRLVDIRVNNHNKINNNKNIGVYINNGLITSSITVNKKQYYLGAFKDEVTAKNYYNEALKHVDNDFIFWYSNLKIPKNRIGKQIKQLDIDGNLIEIFNSVDDVVKNLGIKKNTIYCNLSGKSKLCNGYKFEYCL
jgi:hypothetical protein